MTDLHAQALALVPWLSERMQREPYESMRARYQILSAFIESTRGKVICNPPMDYGMHGDNCGCTNCT